MPATRSRIHMNYVQHPAPKPGFTFWRIIDVQRYDYNDPGNVFSVVKLKFPYPILIRLP